ncbi:hypothetical protein [Paraburkholderia caffeinilytica]
MDINWSAMFDMVISPLLMLVALFGGGMLLMKLGEKIIKRIRKS